MVPAGTLRAVALVSLPPQRVSPRRCVKHPVPTGDKPHAHAAGTGVLFFLFSVAAAQVPGFAHDLERGMWTLGGCKRAIAICSLPFPRRSAPRPPGPAGSRVDG